MPAAFNKKEKEIIRRSLLDAAKDFAATIGMKKTTVDQLAEKAGISKGGFYKFYDCKESLFFEVMEEAHSAMYDAAIHVLDTRIDLAKPLRAAQAILAIFRVLEKDSLLTFFENDMIPIMRKISTEKIDAHYQSDEIILKEIIEHSQIELNVSIETAMSVLTSISFTAIHRKEISGNFDEAFQILVEAVCEKIVKP